MDGKIYFFWLVTIMQGKWAYSITTSVSGEISENVTFIHKTFPGPAAKRAIIEYSVSFYFSRYVEYLILGIYTTQDHVNLKKNCTYKNYGQVRNTAMHPDFGYRNKNCKLGVNNTRHCVGRITVQDFIPRIISFSFGFWCKHIDYPWLYGHVSLKRLTFNITIYRQTEGVSCFPLTGDSICRNYYKYAGLPNLLGVEHITDSSLSSMMGDSFQCYQHRIELFCHLYTPRCSGYLFHPCREMCHDYHRACGNDRFDMNCNYLPSLNDGIQCYDKKVICDHPMIVKNGAVFVNTTNKRVQIAKYSCNEGFRLEGNSTVTCLYTGEWSSEPPVCLAETPIQKTWVQVLIALFILYIVVMVVIIIVVIHRMRLKSAKEVGFQGEQVETDIELKEIDEPLMLYRKKKDLMKTDPSVKRNRVFDAFVLYHFDSDANFVVETLLPELEEARDFKLCIHSRDFTPGRDIKDNIEEAIEGSNSAIIIMSQGFVDSMWCKEEFTHCYIENMKDPAFNLFVIMMQPVDTLVNISDYMKTFIANKTYLQIKDPELFTKLGNHLEDAKQLDNDDVYNNNHDENLNNNEDQIEEFNFNWHLDEMTTQEIKV